MSSRVRKCYQTPMDSIADLRARATGGDAAAQFRLAAALERAGDLAGADLWLARAAAAGHAGALSARAIRLLEAPPPAMDAAAAAAMLLEAARRGAGEAALRLAVLKALGLGAPEDWEGALGLVKEAAQRGHPGARRQVRFLAALNAEPGSRTAARPARPAITAIKNSLSADERAYVIAAAGPLLKPSAVVDPALGGARAASFRSSAGAAIGLLALDLPLIAIWKKLCRLAGFEPAHSELMGVLRYLPGEEYRPHHDYLPEDAADYSEVRRAGQRAATLLTPLNSGYEGGETTFPKLGLSFRLPAGDSLLFENVDASGAPIPESLHAGAPVRTGEKWMLTLWFRQKRFWFW